MPSTDPRCNDHRHLPNLPAAATRLRAVEIPGPAGRLEGLVNAPDSWSSRSRLYCALVCHPHPPSGGTLHNKVVYNAMKALTGLGTYGPAHQFPRDRPQRRHA